MNGTVKKNPDKSKLHSWRN